MVSTRLVLLGHLHRAAASDTDESTDPQLLQLFLQGRDPGAFAALVRRHGPMVMRVCRHVLHHHQDAEDAFQVTFLVLARSAASIRRKGSLASWLHGVAYRTAMSAKRSAASRRIHEGRAETMSQPDASQDLAWREVQAILEEEIQALPEMYRTPFLLCQMEGRSREEVARQLGIKEGTVSSRLDRARKRLREQLLRRGVALPAVLGALALASERGTAAVPRGLLHATVQAGVAYAAGHLDGGTLSARAEALLKEVTPTMCLTQVKVTTAVLAAVLLVAGAVAVTPRPAHSHAVLAAQTESSKTAPDKSPSPGSGAGKSVTGTAAEPAADRLTVSGRVLDPSGKPIAGAEVSVWWHVADYERTARTTVRATCGPDGRFRLRFAKTDLFDAPHSPHSPMYHFAELEIVAAAKGYGPAWTVVARGSKGEGLTLRLAKDDVPIKGRVLDLQLRPVAGATVRVVHMQNLGLNSWVDMSGTVTTDKEGRFVLTGIGRDRVVHLAVVGPTIERKAFTVSTTNTAAATIEVVAGPTRAVEGTVRAEDTGKPLAGIVIRGGYGYNFPDVYTVTDERGRYRLVGLPKGGSYQVTAWPNRGQPFLPKVRVVGDTQGLTPITADLRLLRGVELRVRLIDKGTRKTVRGIVQYDPLGNNPLREPLRQQRAYPGGFLHWQFPMVYPDKDGYCHLVALPGPGVVLGQGWDLPYLTSPIDPADLKAYPFLEKTPVLGGGLFHLWEIFQSYRVFEAKVGDKPLALDIELDPGLTAEGKLVGPDSRPVTGAIAFGLTHSIQKTSNQSYRHDPSYRARIESQILETDRFASSGLVPKQARTVTFLHAERELIANAVLHADQKGPQTVRMQPWGGVSGRLVDADGKPLVGIAVELVYPSQAGPALLEPGTGGVAPGLLPPGWPFRTDAKGRFRIEGLVPGLKHQLTLSAGADQNIVPAAPGTLKNLSPRAGEVINLGDIRVRVAPAKKEGEKGGKNE